ncbi:hypothetical protein [Muricoccus pecuniae]|uniref:Uncharacterized protein n=1 Tax=Muricoccus pecuniae TaxID=693023 RepID=A0A840Y5D3_9PROT|nr:hypothetical protein [Roseomonas pecuniae]MBB5695955.1 hypothetical protein [Roseomonas pecuniae]
MLRLSARSAVFATRARGDATSRAYCSAWQGFEVWCPSFGREPLAGDSETFAMYAVRFADLGPAVSTLHVHFAAIQVAHRLSGIALDLRHPRLLMVLEDIARSTGTRPHKKAAVAGPDVLQLLP